jgi:nitric oxide reductase subunit C
MNKRQTRLFAIVSTAIAALAFIGLTLDSHRQFPKLTNTDKLTPQVIAGKDAWHKFNCINCHTLFGEGAYYAPDLTKIARQRGEQYLTAYLKNPAQFYDEQRHRRLMPRQNLSDEEIRNLIAFLDWVSNVDNNGWPPRPILVTGATLPVAQAERAPAAGVPPGEIAVGENPMAVGERLFHTAAPACVSCHSVTAGVNMVGPSLAGVGQRGAQVVASAAYKGKAKDAAGYIRESILEPSAYVVPGAMYSANGVSFMPTTYAQSLSPEQLDQLAAYLASLK